MGGNFKKALRAALVLTALSLPQARFAAAQNRINDKDLESLMKNLRDDAKSFQPTFNSAISKSTIRKTSREKDAKNLVASFVKQTDGALNQFKKTRKADANVQNVMTTGQQIDKLVYGLNLGGQTASKWDKIKAELQQIAGAFGLPALSAGTNTATSSVANAQTVSCYSDDGRRRYCDADTHRGVELIRQKSGEPCQQGYSWDYDASGIWVDHGCKADFRID
jgi:hypothetical protein